MSKRECPYDELRLQMVIRGVTSRELADHSGINYQTLRRKLRGESPVLLQDAVMIRKALKLEMPLEQLFHRLERPI